MKNQVLIILLSILFLNSCSDSDSDQELTKPELISFTGWVGEKFYIPIDAKDKSYVLISDDSQVASSEFMNDDQWICVNTIKPGRALVKVVDKDDDKILLEIAVTVSYFGSQNIEEITMHPTLKTEVIVEALNLEIKQMIENKLWDEIKQKKRTLYVFNDKTKEFSMDIVQMEQKKQGTYEWSIDSLVLRYDDTIERYGFEIATGRRNYILWEDKTKEYQTLYPEAGITSIRLCRILYDWDVIGNIGGLNIPRSA